MNAALRRRALWMLWLLLALLPLRGWAGLAMHLPPAQHAAAAAAAAAPCHGMEAASAAGDEAQGDTKSGAACTLCELCHGALLLPDLALPEPDRPAQSWPAAVRVPAPSAEPDPLFRPPRR